MVAESLKVFMNKYPYFFNKDKGSNFYRICDVNNRHFQRLYNDLFRVYESFHISKRVLIWKEQFVPYDYYIHFVVNYDNIKDITIYKNDYPIYFNEYDKKDEKNDFRYTYKCKYVVDNTNELKVYQCTTCDTIYFSNNLNEHCIECDGNTYRRLDVFKCSECDEIYFSDEDIKDCIKNGHSDSLVPIHIYECDNCKEVYFTDEIPERCVECDGVLNPVSVNASNYNLNFNDNVIIDDNRNIVNITPVDEISGSFKKYHFDVDGYDFPITVNIFRKNDDVLVDSLVLSEDNDWEDFSKDLSSDFEYYIEYNPRVQGVSYSSEEIYTYDDIAFDEDREEDVFNVDIPISIIPDDKFMIKINTYDEYTIVKGFPENDDLILDSKGNHVPDVYDHDISLDELGVLSNIPRKRYKIVDDESLLPYTEPPFNNRLSEDDYHYMNRILEYNLRLWWMNPVSLELWKIYGIESELINRERYLLKVFDENKHPFDEESGLVKCWTPLPWEHKDRFCDGTKMDKLYFFAVPDNTNPIVNESVNVSFRVINSFGESVDTGFYVKLFKVTHDGEEVPVYTLNGGKFYGEDIRITANWFDKINVDDFNSYYNTFRFYAYDLNDIPLNVDDNGDAIPVDIVIIVRDYFNSDIHVDNQAYKDYGVGIEEYDNNYANGSSKFPFLKLSDAVNHTTGNNNIIGVNLRDISDAKYIIGDEPLLINTDTKIVGNILENEGVSYVPRIVNRNFDKSFFKLIGGKNVNLTLSNLCLIRGSLKSFIDIDSWNNQNKGLENYENVIIHGGALNLDVEFEDDEVYYPYDFIHMSVSLKRGDTDYMSSNMVRVYYDNVLMDEGLTDEEGVIQFVLNINDDLGDVGTLNITNVSDTFFESTISKSIDISNDFSDYNIIGKNNKFIQNGDNVKLFSENNVNVKLFRDDLGLWYDNVNLNNFVWENVPEGRFIIYVTDNDEIDGEVVDEWLIETKYKLVDFLNSLRSNVPGFSGNLIKNFSINSNGSIEYDLLEITDSMTVDDFRGVLCDVTLESDGEVISISSFNPSSRDEDYFNFNDKQFLKDFVYNVEFTSEGIFKFYHIGDV